MATQYDVLATGSYSIDLIFTGLPSLPNLGREVIGAGFDMIPGEAYNSVVAMHRLGLKVGWAGDFGSDEFSRFALEKIRAEGLDETLFVHHNHPLRRLTVAASFPQDRAFITYYDPDPGVPAALKALPKTSARVFYVPGLYHGRLFDAGLYLVRAKRMLVAMDGNSNEALSLSDPSVRKAVAALDLILPNADEARRLTGEHDLQAAIHALAALCKLVVVKDGPNGAYACQAGAVHHACAIPVTPLDTTGAGDAFNAGFIKAWLDGQSLETCLRWGNVVGGLSTLKRGGTGQMVRTEDVLHWLARMAEN